ncbi:hypothetical protein SUGI_0070190 [Cryptomeria japonica]|uniref:uncharacterized protein LOC131044867 n=1 Tax=Cryptomeria japonica TaxID=3369 RepID=UPI0024089A1E|nr:uncharacterized protein LOC131044867 [Cryptomeria japonica]GLJ07581.1 hypothetical protein SUGI_0070190 [Cryptomeria japonica]
MALEEEEVSIVMRLAKKKFGRFLEGGHTRVYTSKISHGYIWSMTNMERNPFVNALEPFMNEINEGRKMEREYIDQLATHGEIPIRNDRQVIWMEGSPGWTTWVD